MRRGMLKPSLAGIVLMNSSTCSGVGLALSFSFFFYIMAQTSWVLRDAEKKGVSIEELYYLWIE